MLESPCYGFDLQAISDMGSAAPPTYVVGFGAWSRMSFSPRVALASPAMREDQHKVTPEVLAPTTVSGYLDALPDPAEESPIVFPAVSNAEGVGSMISYGQLPGDMNAPKCERLTVLQGEANLIRDDGAKINAAAGTQLLLIRNGYSNSVDLDVYSVPLDRDRLIDASSGTYSTKSITGRDKLDSVLKGQLVTPGMCLYVPGVTSTGMEGRIEWLSAAVRQIRSWNESVPVIIEGNPYSIADPRLDVGPELESKWARIIRTNGIWLAETYPQAAKQSPVMDIFIDLLASEQAEVAFANGPDLTYWAILPKIVAMIDGQSECTPGTTNCFGLQDPGQRFEKLQPGEWTSALSREFDRSVYVNPYSRSLTGDLVYWWGPDGQSEIWSAGN